MVCYFDNFLEFSNKGKLTRNMHVDFSFHLFIYVSTKEHATYSTFVSIKGSERSKHYFK